MATHEIERKWLCTGFTDLLPCTESKVKRQWYLYADANIEIRLSCDEAPNGELSNFKVTNKIGNGLDRIEVQYNVDAKAFSEVWGNIEQPFIRKEFKCYDVKGYELCISRVDGAWFYAEIEFDSTEEAQMFNDIDLPSDVAFRDVTNDHDYAMKNYWRRTRLGEKVN